MDKENIRTADQIADEAKNTPREAINAFFESIGHKQCEACGHNAWHIAGDGTLVQLLRVGDIDKGIPLLCLLCGNCGNTRTFAWGRIRHFIDFEYKKDGTS